MGAREILLAPFEKGGLGDVLSAASIRRRCLFDAYGVARLVQADREGRIDAAYTIFAVVCIELWCRMFIGESRNILGSSGCSVGE